MDIIGVFDPLKEEMFQILDKDGNVVKEEFEPKLTDEELKKIYKYMVLTRVADDKAFKLQRQGRMGTYAQSKGQEATQIGIAQAMEKEDWFFPYFRDLGIQLMRGWPLNDFYLYWIGNERGQRLPDDVNNFTISVPVGTQIPHAVGAAWAAKIKGDKIAVLTTFGDGGTSEGDFHEGLNFAGVFQLPIVFVCQNNQYAISVPRKKQSASKTLAQKAIAYGFDGILVDGNDVLAVYVVVKEALDKARNGGEPTLIESYTYRMTDHTTSDDASRYRSEEEIKEWEEKDPIKRFKLYLKNKGIWDEKFEEEVQKEVTELVDKAVKDAEAVPIPEPEEIFKYNYAEMPWNLEEQLEDLKKFLKEEE